MVAQPEVFAEPGESDAAFEASEGTRVRRHSGWGGFHAACFRQPDEGLSDGMGDAWELLCGEQGRVAEGEGFKDSERVER